MELELSRWPFNLQSTAYLTAKAACHVPSDYKLFMKMYTEETHRVVAKKPPESSKSHI